MLAELSTLPRLWGCARRRVDATLPVPVHLAEGRAHYSNVQTCGSVHACPVCSFKVRTERAHEIERAVVPHLTAGHAALFATFTVPHDQGDRLAPLLEAVADSFRSTIAGRDWYGSWVHGASCPALNATNPDHTAAECPTGTAWRHGCENPRKCRWDARRGPESLPGPSGCPDRWWHPGDRRRFAILGTIRALEVNHGENGWHPHLHALLLLDRELEGWELDQLKAALHDRWCAAITRHGYRRPSDQHGTRILPVRNKRDLADYMCKVYDESGIARSVGNELTRHDLKAGRRAGRNPFRILLDLHTWGDTDDLSLWWEYEQATKGHQALTWSAGLKDQLGVVDKTDEEIAAEEVGGEVIAEVLGHIWRQVCRLRGMRARLLRAAELHGAAGVYELLDTIEVDEAEVDARQERQRHELETRSLPRSTTRDEWERFDRVWRRRHGRERLPAARLNLQT